MTDECITADDCRKILKKVTKNGKFINFSLRSLAGDVEGYLSAHFSLEIKYIDAEKDGAETKSFFMKKHAVDCGFLAEFAKSLDVFKKETFIYELCKHLHSLKSFQTFSPICYLQKHDLLVMEDLTTQGYKVTEKNTFYNLNQCKISLKTLSYYHAACVSYEELKTKETGIPYRLNTAYPNEFEEKIFTENEENPTFQYLQSSIKAVLDLIDEIPDDKCQNKEEFKELVQKVEKEHKNNEKFKEKYRYICVHGDLWSKNIMFKTIEDKITDCRLVDFQLLRYYLPGFDVVLFLYANTTVAFRKQNRDDLFKYYYMCLQAELYKNDVECSKLFPYQDLLDGAVISAPVAKIQAFNDTALMHLREDLLVQAIENPDLFRDILIENRSKYILDAFNTNSDFRSFVFDELLDLKNILEQKQLFLNNNNLI